MSILRFDLREITEPGAYLGMRGDVETVDNAHLFKVKQLGNSLMYLDECTSRYEPVSEIHRSFKFERVL